MLRHYGWNKVAIITNTGILAYDRVLSFEEVFHQRGINVVKKIMFDEFADSKAMIASGLLNDIKNSARSEFFFELFSKLIKNFQSLFAFSRIQENRLESF